MKAPNTISAKPPTGKVKVNFDSANNMSDEDGGDFKPLKIKNVRSRTQDLLKLGSQKLLIRWKLLS